MLILLYCAEKTDSNKICIAGRTSCEQ